ncbi:MAG TPA: DUF3472 domain-containing protein [Fimbriiglobus sp.]|jgi:hypothetical protein
MRGWILVLVSSATVAAVRADAQQTNRACRSVHLRYAAGEGTAFYNEVTVDRSAPGTYFCACGWNKGYFGIQEQGRGKKVVIFSVWDSPQNDRNAVPEDRRVKLLHKDEKVRTGRFGGEGSGGQSFLDYDWKVGSVYRFLVAAKVVGDRTEYAGYFRGPDEKEWKHLVTFSTVTGGKNLSGYYSFVEDFKRDRVSFSKIRKAYYGNTWVKTVKGKWEPAVKAKFTGDRTPVTNIDAGVDKDRFFLATGGETKNLGTKLNDFILLPADRKRSLPEGLPKMD